MTIEQIRLAMETESPLELLERDGSPVIYPDGRTILVAVVAVHPRAPGTVEVRDIRTGFRFPRSRSFTQLRPIA